VGTILLVSASFGSGHDVAARRLGERLTGLGFTTRQVDLLDLLPAGSGHAFREAYRWQLRAMPYSWTWLSGWMEHRRGMRAAGWVGALAGRRLMELISPDTVAVVSTYPLASALLGRLRASGTLCVPVVTLLTDMSVHPLWIADGVDAYIALHDVAADAARRLGAINVMVCSPIVPPVFRPAEPGEQAEARRRFDLPPSATLALVVTGSWGVGNFRQTAVDLAATGLAMPVVACGRNEAGRVRLESRGIGRPLGWVRDMAALFHACDVVIQSGGGCSVHEALACGRPVLTYRCLPGHGRGNAAALHDAGWAPWVKRPTDLPAAIASALQTPVFVPPSAVDAVHVVASAIGIAVSPERRVSDPIASVSRPLVST
jgi:UDP-N-acetylglucosamine:LPS N-acetylglucosamine transferase